MIKIIIFSIILVLVLSKYPTLNSVSLNNKKLDLNTKKITVQFDENYNEIGINSVIFNILQKYLMDEFLINCKINDFNGIVYCDNTLDSKKFPELSILLSKNNTSRVYKLIPSLIIDFCDVFKNNTAKCVTKIKIIKEKTKIILGKPFFNNYIGNNENELDFKKINTLSNHININVGEENQINLRWINYNFLIFIFGFIALNLFQFVNRKKENEKIHYYGFFFIFSTCFLAFNLTLIK